jgi:hypothetical protein
MRTVTLKREVPVKLSEPERRKMGEELAALEVEYEEVAEAARDSAALARERKKELRNEISALANALKDGEIKRLLHCREVLDPEAKTVDLIRIDNDEVVLTRPARPEELQIGIPYEPRDEAAPEFAVGNVVKVTSVPAAAGAVYQIESIEAVESGAMAALGLVVSADGESAPEHLEGISVEYLVPATILDMVHIPAPEAPGEHSPDEESSPATPRRRGRPRKKAA